MSVNPKTTEANQNAFLAAYQEVGMVTPAAEAAKISRGAHYHWLRSNPEYRKRFEAAQLESSDVIEDHARKLALEGVLEPVFYEGQICGHKIKYSTDLIKFLLQANNPEKFGNKIEQKLSGEVAQPVQFYLPAGRKALDRPDGGDSEAN